MPKAAIHAPTNMGRARAAAANNGSGYSVYDPVGQKIGIVERVFANPDGEPVYIRVRIGFCADPGTVRRDSLRALPRGGHRRWYGRNDRRFG